MAISVEPQQSNIWWLFLLQGLAEIILGLLLITAPGLTTIAIVGFLGFYWLIMGILALVRVFVDRSVPWAWSLLIGIVGILAGLSVVKHPLLAAIGIPTAIIIILGIQGLVMGVLEIVSAFAGGGIGSFTAGAIYAAVGLSTHQFACRSGTGGATGLWCASPSTGRGVDCNRIPRTSLGRASDKRGLDQRPTSQDARGFYPMTMMREPSTIMLIVLSAALATPSLAQTGNILSDNYSIMVPEKGKYPNRNCRNHGLRRNTISERISSRCVFPIENCKPTEQDRPGNVYVPQTGRTFQNLPTTGRGTKTSQDRAIRCTHQAGAYGQAGSARGGYMGSCL